jgi:hypothetical protein
MSELFFDLGHPYTWLLFIVVIGSVWMFWVAVTKGY